MLLFTSLCYRVVVVMLTFVTHKTLIRGVARVTTTQDAAGDHQVGNWLVNCQHSSFQSHSRLVRVPKREDLGIIVVGNVFTGKMPQLSPNERCWLLLVTGLTEISEELRTIDNYTRLLQDEQRKLNASLTESRQRALDVLECQQLTSVSHSECDSVRQQVTSTRVALSFLHVSETLHYNTS